MSISPSNPRARLAGHVRACHVDGQLIFLDLRRSRYFGIGGPQLPVLAETLLGHTTRESTTNPALLDEWIGRLRRQQLLSDAPATETMVQLTVLPEPVAGLALEDDDRVADFEWRHLVRLWRATLVTTAWLRRRSLADIVDRIATLRARHSRRGTGLGTDAMEAAAARYMRLRPFALTSHDRCLADSLTLLHFLATQGLFPRWVIGVRTRPFGAHSWVQSGGVVLNDQPEHVRRYRPILVV